MSKKPIDKRLTYGEYLYQIKQDAKNALLIAKEQEKNKLKPKAL